MRMQQAVNSMTSSISQGSKVDSNSELTQSIGVNN